MKLKGNVVFYSVRDFNIEKEKLEEVLTGLEFDPAEFLPRNDFKSAMIKALKSLNKAYTGSGKQDYERFHDEGQFASFTVYELNPLYDDVDFNKRLTIKLDKEHGNIQVVSQTASDEFVNRLKAEYAKEKESLNSQQFRSTVLRVIKKQCHGFSLLPGGGTYFINPAFDAAREKLHRLFDQFKGHMSFHSVPVYDDQGTMAALQEAATYDIFNDIESLVRDVDRDFKTGVITKRRLEGDKAKAKEIIDKISIHEEHLRSEADNIRARMSRVMSALEEVTTRVERDHVDPEDFSNLLKDL